MKGDLGMPKNGKNKILCQPVTPPLSTDQVKKRDIKTAPQLLPTFIQGPHVLECLHRKGPCRELWGNDIKLFEETQSEAEDEDRR